MGKTITHTGGNVQFEQSTEDYDEEDRYASRLDVGNYKYPQKNNFIELNSFWTFILLLVVIGFMLGIIYAVYLILL